LFLVFGAGVLVAALTLFLLPTSRIKIALFALLIGLAIHLFGIFDAYACAKRANTKEFEEDRSKDPDPWRAAFLSALLPGLGLWVVPSLRWLAVVTPLGMLIAGAVVGATVGRGMPGDLVFPVLVVAAVYVSYRVAAGGRPSSPGIVAYLAFLGISNIA